MSNDSHSTLFLRGNGVRGIVVHSSKELYKIDRQLAANEGGIIRMLQGDQVNFIET